MRENGRKDSSKTASAVRGAGWLGLSTMGEYVLTFATMIVLARLVTPAEFGTVGLAISFMTVARLFSEIAMAPALIRRESVTPAHIDVAFISVMALAIFVSVAIVLAGPALAKFFRTPELREMCWAIAFLIPLQASTSVSNALLSRKTAFRFMAVSKVPGLLLGYTCTSIILAALGFGAWSIMFGAIVQHSLTAAITFAGARYTPRLAWSRNAFRDLFAFSLGQSVAQAINHCALVGDNLVVGRALGMESLGLYGRAYRLMELPVNVVSTTSYNVAFPLLSSIQTGDARLSNAYRSALSALLTLLIPLAVFLVFTARPLVLLILGDDWEGVIVPFQILCVSLTFRAAYRHVNLPTLIRGGTFTIAVLSALYATWVIGGSIAAVIMFGTTTAVAAAVSIAIFVHYLTSAWSTNRLLKITWIDFAKLHAPGLATGFVLALSLAIAENLPWLGEDVITDLLVYSAVAIVIAGSSVISLPRLFLGRQNLSTLDRIAPSIPVVGGVLKAWTGFASGRA